MYSSTRRVRIPAFTCALMQAAEVVITISPHPNCPPTPSTHIPPYSCLPCYGLRTCAALASCIRDQCIWVVPSIPKETCAAADSTPRASLHFGVGNALRCSGVSRQSQALCVRLVPSRVAMPHTRTVQHARPCLHGVRMSLTHSLYPTPFVCRQVMVFLTSCLATFA